MCVALAACRADMAAWRAHLAEPAVARLDGAWTIALRSESGGYSRTAPPVQTIGFLALVLNHRRVTTGLFSTPPVAFGTYDLRLDTLDVATAEEVGTPDLWAFVRGDSVWITLSPKAKWPVTMTGSWRGDSIAGRWHADQRAGPSGVGDFVMHRR